MNQTSHAARRNHRLALLLAAIVALGVAGLFFHHNPLLHQHIEKGDPAYVEALASNGKLGYVKKADLEQAENGSPDEAKKVRVYDEQGREVGVLVVGPAGAQSLDGGFAPEEA